MFAPDLCYHVFLEFGANDPVMASSRTSRNFSEDQKLFLVELAKLELSPIKKWSPNVLLSNWRLMVLLLNILASCVESGHLVQKFQICISDKSYINRIECFPVLKSLCSIFGWGHNSNMATINSTPNGRKLGNFEKLIPNDTHFIVIPWHVNVFIPE